MLDFSGFGSGQLFLNKNSEIALRQDKRNS